MINVGKCPNCEATITSVKVEHIDVKQGFQTKFHGVSYLCNSCDVVLSVAIDPISLKVDTVAETVRALKR